MELFSWGKKSGIDDSLKLLLTGVKLDPVTALRTVAMLEKASEDNIRIRVGAGVFSQFFPSNRHGGLCQPSGWVDHYTAALDARGTLIWFSNRDRGPGVGNSSAHFVIDHDGTVMVVIPHKFIAWHATIANTTHLGAEMVNTGLLGKAGIGYTYMNNIRYPAERIGRVYEVNGEAWEAFTVLQILSNIALKRLMICTLPYLQKDKFIDHQKVSTTSKRDCGPLWPLDAINKIVFSWCPIDIKDLVTDAFPDGSTPIANPAVLTTIKNFAAKLP